MDVTQAQVAKMDDLLQHLHEENAKVEGLIKKPGGIRFARHEARHEDRRPQQNVDKRYLTAVIGNLEGLSSLAQAQTWLKDKLSVLQGPSPTQVYGEGVYQGMVFAEFKDQFDRDLAVTLLNTAGLQQIRVFQDRDPVERAARNFCFGLEKVFKEKWNIPYNVRISNAKTLHNVSGRRVSSHSPRFFR